MYKNICVGSSENMSDRYSKRTTTKCMATHWRSQRGGLRGIAPQRMRKNIKASLVTLTVNMRYKNDKQYQICHYQIRFSSSKCTKIYGPRWGSLRRSPRPPSRLGRGIPPPRSTPSASRFSGPPQHKILATPVWLPRWSVSLVDFLVL